MVRASSGRPHLKKQKNMESLTFEEKFVVNCRKV